MHKLDAQTIIAELQALGSSEKARTMERFFKTGPGHYGHGDIFWGISVPETRKVARKYAPLEADQLEILLEHSVHEVRQCALLIMVMQAKKFPKQAYALYLKKIDRVNNWDLVDVSAPAIVGDFLLDKDYTPLYELAQTPALWKQRIAIVATYAFIKKGKHEHTFTLAETLMNHEHDLIHKAIGWMLREVGKRCSEGVLESFLEKHAAIMPRTMLRYALEHLSDTKRSYFMQAKSRKQD